MLREKERPVLVWEEGGAQQARDGSSECHAAIDDILKYCFFLYKDVGWGKAVM